MDLTSLRPIAPHAQRNVHIQQLLVNVARASGVSTSTQIQRGRMSPLLGRLGMRAHDMLLRSEQGEDERNDAGVAFEEDQTAGPKRRHHHRRHHDKGHRCLLGCVIIKWVHRMGRRGWWQLYSPIGLAQCIDGENEPATGRADRSK